MGDRRVLRAASCGVARLGPSPAPASARPRVHAARLAGHRRPRSWTPSQTPARLRAAPCPGPAGPRARLPPPPQPAAPPRSRRAMRVRAPRRRQAARGMPAAARGCRRARAAQTRSCLRSRHISWQWDRQSKPCSLRHMPHGSACNTHSGQTAHCHHHMPLGTGAHACIAKPMALLPTEAQACIGRRRRAPPHPLIALESCAQRAQEDRTGPGGDAGGGSPGAP